MKLQVMFIIAVVALFSALSAVSVRAEPGDGGSDVPVRPDRVSDVQLTDVCREVADLCADGGRFCRTHAELCRRIAKFCHENPELCRSFIQFCRTHQNLCERIIEFCNSHDVRCRTVIANCVEHPERCRYLLSCIAHPDRCGDRPSDRPVPIRDRSNDREATDRSRADVACRLAGAGD